MGKIQISVNNLLKLRIKVSNLIVDKEEINSVLKVQEIKKWKNNNYLIINEKSLHNDIISNNMIFNSNI